MTTPLQIAARAIFYEQGQRISKPPGRNLAYVRQLVMEDHPLQIATYAFGGGKYFIKDLFSWLSHVNNCTANILFQNVLLVSGSWLDDTKCHALIVLAFTHRSLRGVENIAWGSSSLLDKLDRLFDVVDTKP